MMPKLPRILLLLFSLTVAISGLAQGVREHTKPGESTDPARARYRLGNNTKAAGTEVNDTQAANVTLGLPYVRTSPDHGTAFSIAGKGEADPSGMEAALRCALDLVGRAASPLLAQT